VKAPSPHETLPLMPFPLERFAGSGWILWQLESLLWTILTVFIDLAFLL
jgi:hypothetical protein